MKYDNITKRKNRMLLEEQLCKLYIKCECLEEFLIKVNLTYGKIPWRLLTSFKLFYIRKSKPLLYYSVKFSYYILLVGCTFTFNLYFLMLLLLPISELIFCYMFYDIMKTIELYEDSCHVDY
jgi:hypothetical protein